MIAETNFATGAEVIRTNMAKSGVIIAYGGRKMIDYNEAQKMIAELMAENISLSDFGRLEYVANTLSDCRNELCSRCGRHIDAHLGACDKCRWR